MPQPVQWNVSILLSLTMKNQVNRGNEKNRGSVFYSPFLLLVLLICNCTGLEYPSCSVNKFLLLEKIIHMMCVVCHSLFLFKFQKVFLFYLLENPTFINELLILLVELQRF